MKIERVRLLTTLKAGEQVWVKGKILTSPIPADIITEIKNQTGTVEVLEGEGYLEQPKSKLESKLIKRAKQ